MAVTATTFKGFVHLQLSKLKVELEKHNPAKSNSAIMMGTAMFWDEVQSFAKKQSDQAWKALEDEKIVDLKGLTEGTHELASSPQFSVIAKMTKPVRSFSGPNLAEALKKKFKVPVPATMELIEQTKSEGKGRVTLEIIERG